MLNEIFKGMDNAAEIINENFAEVKPMITKHVNSKIQQSGLAAGGSETIPAGSRIMFIVGGRQSSGSKIFGFYDGFTHFVHLVTPNLIEIRKDGDNLVIENKSNSWCSVLVVS